MTASQYSQRKKYFLIFMLVLSVVWNFMLFILAHHVNNFMYSVIEYTQPKRHLKSRRLATSSADRADREDGLILTEWMWVDFYDPRPHPPPH